MIGAEKTAGMLTTIFLGGNESRRLSSLPLPGGGEGSLNHPFLPPPPILCRYRIEKPLIALLLLWRMGGGEGAARNVIPSSLPMDIPCCRYSRPSFALSTGIAREESDLTDEQRKEKLK